MLNDIRFALRQLCKSPGFTLIAVLTLALGIGMNTAMFSLIHDLFLRGLPFSEPERIVHIYGEAKERDLQQMPFSVPKFWHYRDGQNVFTERRCGLGQRLHPDRTQASRCNYSAETSPPIISNCLASIRFSAAIFCLRKRSKETS